MSGETAQAGFEAKAYLNTASLASPVWAEIDKIKDLSNPSSVDKLDASARFGSRKRYVPGMFDDSLSFGYQKIKGLADPIFSALETAYRTRAYVEIRLCDGDNATAGTNYIQDVYMIETMDRGENLADLVTYDLTLAPTVIFDGDGDLVVQTTGTVSA